MKKYKLQIIITAVLVAAACYFLLLKEEKVTVNTMNAYMGSITRTLQVTGIINSDDVEVIPLEPGIEVVKTYINENDLVDSNQLLAELDTRDLFISLEKAQLNLEDLNAKLNEITMDNYDMSILENTLSSSKEEYSKSLEDLNVAKEDLKKAEILYYENAISKVEYDQYVTSVNNLSSRLKITELNLDNASVNYNESKEQKLQDKLTLERQIKSLNLDIESLNNKIEDSKLYSAISGIVTEFPIEESRRTLSGESITIHGTSSYELTALVSQQDAVLIKEGQKSFVTVDGINAFYEGAVTFVSRAAGTDNSGSALPKVKIKIKILNPDDYLTFGYEGEAKIIIDSQEDVVIVKNESVKKEGNKEFVYLLNNNTVKKTYVETGLSDGYLISIKSGINESDVIVVNPPVDLIDGMKVKWVE